jgi:hypothetical protein
MTEKPKTKSEGLRLTLEHWTMLRSLIQAKGRSWLEKLIAREHRKMEEK